MREPTPRPDPPPGARTATSRALAAVSGVAIALALFVAFLLSRGGLTAGDLERALLDEDVKRMAAEVLVDRAGGAWDAFPDADVGRVLQAGLEGRRFGHIDVSSNRMGLREREYEIPKPAGMLRIVLLGDSFVFGNGVAEQERLGACLERHLRERARGAPPPLEVLHVGIMDWNIVAEATYLRRQLSRLSPDLVIHVLIYNDLDDMGGVRGFGTISSFCPQVRHRADSFVSTRQPYVMGFGQTAHGESLLNAGLDWESNERYRRAGEEMRRLDTALEGLGAGYVAVLFWPRYTAVAEDRLLSLLDEDAKTYVPREVFASEEWSVSEVDRHWNPAALERIARQLYSLLQRNDVLPALELEPWPAADRTALEWHATGRRQANEPLDLATQLRGQRIAPRIDFGALSENTAAQVHGGAWKDGILTPYASMILANPRARELVVHVRTIDLPELDGTTTVFLDEVQVGRLPQPAPPPVERRFAVPAELRDRPYLSVRFESSDFAYRGPGMRQSVALQIESVALE